MSTQIIATKFYIPTPCAKVVLRTRLIEQLNKGLASGHRLTLISAPAGFRKTMLVSEWVAGCERSTAWLSLDENNNDPVRFLIYLISALQKISLNLGAGLPDALHASHPQVPPTKGI